MDFHLKQWGGQQHQLQSDTYGPNYELHKSSYAYASAAKIPKLLFDTSSPFYPHHQPCSLSNSHAAAVSTATTTTTLPLFVPKEVREEGGGKEGHGQGRTAHPYSKLSTTFPCSDHHQSRIPRNHCDYSNTGSYFNCAQWQELELQALIFRYLMAGATVPPELLQPIKKSLLLHSSPNHFLHSHFPAFHYPPAAVLLHSGYWGKSAMDPEPGRCKRTDGKKWRCSRDVVVGHKYCERHMHRGRNRSRKHVEISHNAASSESIFKSACPINTVVLDLAGGSGSHHSLSGSSPSSSVDVFHLNKSLSSKVKPRNPADSSRPDVSLKLSTGNGDEPSGNTSRDGHPPMSIRTAGVASMGGPLAEAILRSSSNTVDSSPTSVLHHLARGSTSVASFITT